MGKPSLLILLLFSSISPAAASFILSDGSLIQLAYESQQQNPNPNPNLGCVLSSPYVRPLFNFDMLVGANCNPEMYNARPDGSPDYLSIGHGHPESFLEVKRKNHGS